MNLQYNNKKILFIAGDICRIGGIEKYNRDFCEAIKKTGAQVLLVTRKEGHLWKKISFGIRVFWSFIYYRPDFICCGHLNFAPLCLIIKFIFKVEYSVALYGIEISGIKKYIKSKSVKESTILVTISEYAKKEILKFSPFVEERIFLLPSSVDGHIFKIKSKSECLISRYNLLKRPVILSLARLSPGEHKGQDRVLKALPLVLKKIPEAVYLVVGGGNDERIEAVLHENPNLKSSIVFTGAVKNEDRIDFYNLADVFVLPSKFEGFGIVFIESLACGVPVVASDSYGCREGLLDGELGLLVSPDDVSEIAESILSILEKTAPQKLFDRDFLRLKTLEVYGKEKWDEKVFNFVGRII
jgi:phosphatidyl-myo-inositol dimannoside synthase